MKNRLVVLTLVVFCLPLFATGQVKNLLQTAESAGTFKTLLAAIRAAGLSNTLQGEAPLTVFAPTDDAFAKLPAGTIQNLLKPENRERLKALLTYHVVSGKIKSNALLTTNSTKTVNGARLPIGLTVQNARVLQTDIIASNGIIHVIDAVLIPPDPLSETRNNDRQQTRHEGETYSEEQFNTSHVQGAKTDFRRAKNQIEQSIARGSEVYNKGDASACAALYIQTAKNLIVNEPLTNAIQTRLEQAIQAANHNQRPNERAWLMRRTLEMVYEAL